MALARGFKSYAKKLAIEVRGELDAALHEPFDPWKLAREYGVEVVPLSALDELSPEVRIALTVESSNLFSGALLSMGTARVIVENDSHDLCRRRSTVAHEMSHLILEHLFTTILIRDDKECRNSDRDQELEAAELAGELLVPADAAKRLALRSLSDEDVAGIFGSSVEMARWRMNASGARIIAKRSRRRRS